MRKNRARRLSVLAGISGLLSMCAAVSAPAATAETGVLGAACVATFTTNGVEAPPLPVSGSIRILGSAPATVRVDEPILFSDVRATLALDWETVRPEFEKRGLTTMTGYLQGLHIDRRLDGVQDWPFLVWGPFMDSFPVERLGTGVVFDASRTELEASPQPGTYVFANYGTAYFSLHWFGGPYDPQVRIGVKCTPDDGQDQTFGVTTVTP